MITGATENSSGEYLEHYRGIPEHYRAIIWEFENSFIGQNFSIIYKSLALTYLSSSIQNGVTHTTPINQI